MGSKIHRNSLKPGHKINSYEIIEILGQGGFGITYLAKDIYLNRKVAIKEYLPIELAVREGDHSVHPVSEDRSKQFKWGLDRFLSEARTLAQFKHPNIVQIYAVFEANNTGYMVMAYEHGQSLQQKLAGKKTLEESELLKILIPILGGLEQIHKTGFIHRDIKPDNIFIREDGSPVLLDFGSARQALGEQTKTLTSLVSPGYAPFEQYYSKSDQQGPWTDIYGLGATLYRAIAGMPPMDAVDRSNAILKSKGDTFVPATAIGRGNYSERFLKAIDHALQFKEEDRPQTISTWKAEFDLPEDPSKKAIIAERITTQPGTKVLEKRQQKKWLFGKVALVGVIITVAISYVYQDEIQGYFGPTKEQLEAERQRIRENVMVMERISGIPVEEENRVAALKQIDKALTSQQPDVAPVQPSGGIDWEGIDAALGTSKYTTEELTLQDKPYGKLNPLRYLFGLEGVAKMIPAFIIGGSHSFGQKEEADRKAKEQEQQRAEAEAQRLAEIENQKQEEARKQELERLALEEQRKREQEEEIKRKKIEQQHLAELERQRADDEKNRLAEEEARQQIKNEQLNKERIEKQFQDGVTAYNSGNYSEALNLFMPLAEQGYAKAQFFLGDLYTGGKGVPQDDKQAVYWLQKAAEQGLAVSQYVLGTMYASGKGVPQDDKQAVQWYQKAAEQGYADWFQKAAEQGDAEAQFLLGTMYDLASGVPENDKQAVYWNQKAAEQGHAGAQFFLGSMYDLGSGVPEDDKQAVYWYQKSAEQGHAEAQYFLGLKYAAGSGVPQDDKQAVQWIQKAADQGNENAIRFLSKQ